MTITTITPSLRILFLVTGYKFGSLTVCQECPLMVVRQARLVFPFVERPRTNQVERVAKPTAETSW